MLANRKSQKHWEHQDTGVCGHCSNRQILLSLRWEWHSDTQRSLFISCSVLFLLTKGVSLCQFTEVSQIYDFSSEVRIQRKSRGTSFFFWTVAYAIGINQHTKFVHYSVSKLRKLNPLQIIIYWEFSTLVLTSSTFCFLFAVKETWLCSIESSM